MYFSLIYVTPDFRLVSKTFGSGELSGIQFPQRSCLELVQKKKKRRNLVPAEEKGEKKAERALQEHCSADTLTVCHE